MGVFEQSSGNGGSNGHVRLFGFQDSLSLDARGRFRLPDELAATVHREMGRLQSTAGAEAPAAAYQKLAFYFVPGTGKRIFLYPVPNIDLAVSAFESPPPGLEPDVVRRARDYFYFRMRFTEADKQNRLVIPEGLRRHADIDETVSQVTLVAQNFWLALSRTEAVEQATAENLEAFEQAAPDLLNPVYRTPRPSSPESGPDQ
jgi:DNA-binding transcriptional regulator/RsmH inhibitor MraZ